MKIWTWILVGLLLVGVGFGIAKLTGHPPSAGIEHRIPFSINVTATGDFGISVTPVNDVGEAELTIRKGESAAFTITTIAAGGFDARIFFQVAGLPEGSYSFSQNPAPAGTPVTLTIDTTTLTTNTAYICELIAIDN